MSKDTKKNFVLFALITGLFGFLAGILTAPKSGKETREDIKDRAHDIKQTSITQLTNIEAELGKLIKEVSGKASRLNNKARSEYNEATIRARDAQNKSKTVLKAVKNGTAENDDLDLAVKQAKDAIKNLSKYLKS